MAGITLKRYAGSGVYNELYPKTTPEQIVATGTPNSSTYLRGDGTWSSIPSIFSSGRLIFSGAGSNTDYIKYDDTLNAFGFFADQDDGLAVSSGGATLYAGTIYKNGVEVATLNDVGVGGGADVIWGNTGSYFTVSGVDDYLNLGISKDAYKMYGIEWSTSTSNSYSRNISWVKAEDFDGVIGGLRGTNASQHKIYLTAFEIQWESTGIIFSYPITHVTTDTLGSDDNVYIYAVYGLN